MSPTLQQVKCQLREQCRKTRTELGVDFRRDASAAICNHIETWSLFLERETILTYMPMRGEVTLIQLIERMPLKHWLLPRIQPEGRMTFHPYNPQRLIRHPYGMLEPAADLAPVSVENIELALVPGLAFDHHGWRLGYGGGFFDRFLVGFTHGLSLGITYHALLLDHLPHHQHDIPVEYLVTEEGVVKCSTEQSECTNDKA